MQYIEKLDEKFLALSIMYGYSFAIKAQLQRCSAKPLRSMDNLRSYQQWK
jgi:hypothetical protein